MNEIKYSSDVRSNTYKDSTNIRKIVFINEQNVPENLEIDDKEDQCTYFNLYSDNKAVATARFFPLDDGGIHVQRVAVLKNYRHKNLGSQLLKYIFKFAKKQGYNYVILGAQDHAQNFYKELGFKVIGKQYQEVGIAHHDMKLLL
ncbi:GNAT family N-acetyltransferase [Companilactobacillus halodurans]|uniref:GNAT family N-acetyltransferase n=1 Tax=Companilactobacillus halodurans TaxID=2584183 RepID=A0A5P1A0S0_9LACO|nr:GNAT family N-acetyltransferase [Companilactobacillus halodurans]MQS75932.1 GNAT family N-acetyltransferase [Companilactobacillus halodurans]MQS98542.1 GNAT family N-acetyltransferase [Companilactobacillus halodurans]